MVKRESPLSVPVGQQILLNFTVFDMENHTNCNFDYLEIRYSYLRASFPFSPIMRTPKPFNITHIGIYRVTKLFTRFC